MRHPRAVLCPDPSRVAHIDVSLPPQDAWREEILPPSMQGTPEPCANGRSESVLGPFEERRRDIPCEHLPQDPLPLPPPDLELERQAGGELDNAVIEVGCARFQP